MFDVITYEKGAALVRMLEQYLGPETFRAGVRLYLRRHAYGNTVTEDLWNALAEASGQPVGQIMGGWIYQGGYPAVSAVAGAHGLEVSQRHFTLDPDRAEARSWTVPLRLRVQRPDGDRHELRLLLDQPRRTLTVVAGQTVTLNSGASGFYRDDPDAEGPGRPGGDGAGRPHPRGAPRPRRRRLGRRAFRSPGRAGLRRARAGRVHIGARPHRVAGHHRQPGPPSRAAGSGRGPALLRARRSRIRRRVRGRRARPPRPPAMRTSAPASCGPR